MANPEPPLNPVEQALEDYKRAVARRREAELLVSRMKADLAQTEETYRTRFVEANNAREAVIREVRKEVGDE